MKHVFEKAWIPEIEAMLGAEGRTFWNLGRFLQDERDFSRQPDLEEFLFQQGAYRGDVWCMTEFARYLFRRGALPQALSWWNKSAAWEDQGAAWDLSMFPMEDRILHYACPTASHFSNVKTRCAMLTQWVLRDLGKTEWSALSQQEQERRCRQLTEKCCGILSIPQVRLEFRESLQLNGQVVQGLSYPVERLIEICSDVLHDFGRLVQVLFHELGHFLVWSMLDPAADERRKLFDVTEELAEAWREDRVGKHISAQEEGADTLSYGVWMIWYAYFG